MAGGTALEVIAPIPPSVTLSRTEKYTYIETILNRLYKKILCVSNEQMPSMPSWFSSFTANQWLTKYTGHLTPPFLSPVHPYPDT